MPVNNPQERCWNGKRLLEPLLQVSGRGVAEGLCAELRAEPKRAVMRGSQTAVVARAVTLTALHHRTSRALRRSGRRTSLTTNARRGARSSSPPIRPPVQAKHQTDDAA